MSPASWVVAFCFSSIVDITGQEDVMGGFQGLGPSVSGEVPAETPPAEETITETSSSAAQGESQDSSGGEN